MKRRLIKDKFIAMAFDHQNFVSDNRFHVGANPDTDNLAAWSITEALRCPVGIYKLVATIEERKDGTVVTKRV